MEPHALPRHVAATSRDRRHVCVKRPWLAAPYRADKNEIASTTSHPTITKEATAPAMILDFSLAV